MVSREMRQRPMLPSPWKSFVVAVRLGLKFWYQKLQEHALLRMQSCSKRTQRNFRPRNLRAIPIHWLSADIITVTKPIEIIVVYNMAVPDHFFMAYIFLPYIWFL